MTPDQYRTTIAALSLSQRAAARIIGIDERTSRKYAKNGVPASSVPFVNERLAQFALTKQANKAEEE